MLPSAKFSDDVVYCAFALLIEGKRPEEIGARLRINPRSIENLARRTARVLRGTIVQHNIRRVFDNLSPDSQRLLFERVCDKIYTSDHKDVASELSDEVCRLAALELSAPAIASRVGLPIDVVRAIRREKFVMGGFSDEMLERANELMQEGKSVNEIARILQRPEDKVSQWLKGCSGLKLDRLKPGGRYYLRTKLRSDALFAVGNCVEDMREVRAIFMGVCRAAMGMVFYLFQTEDGHNRFTVHQRDKELVFANQA